MVLRRWWAIVNPWARVPLQWRDSEKRTGKSGPEKRTGKSKPTAPDISPGKNFPACFFNGPGYFFSTIPRIIRETRLSRIVNALCSPADKKYMYIHVFYIDLLRDIAYYMHIRYLTYSLNCPSRAVPDTGGKILYYGF